ncbi:molybdopterin-dependent oxidoreductase [Pseudomonas sp. PCH446]
MVSYAAGARYLSLIGGVCLSFYDWYCDLPPASPMVWGEQTDVPESADWYNSNYIIAWVPTSRRPVPRRALLHRGSLQGHQDRGHHPRLFGSGQAHRSLAQPKQGTDAALAQAFNHVIFKEFHLDKPSAYFTEYAKRFTDLPVLVLLKPMLGVAPGAGYQPDRFLRASDLTDNLGQENNPEWKTIALDASGELVSPRAPSAIAGARRASGTSLPVKAGKGARSI